MSILFVLSIHLFYFNNYAGSCVGVAIVLDPVNAVIFGKTGHLNTVLRLDSVVGIQKHMHVTSNGFETLLQT